MIQILDKNGKKIRFGKNLRVITRHITENNKYHKLNLIKKIVLNKINNGGGKLLILWENGDSVETNFADYSVMENWAKNKRQFKGLSLVLE